MTGKIGTLDLDDFIQRYANGEHLSRLAKEAHTDFRTARKRLVALGISIRSISEANRMPLDVDALARRYRAGESTCEIARDLGISDTTVSDALKRAGHALRDASSRTVLQVAKRPPEVMARAQAARIAARRGQRDTMRTKRQRAVTNHERQPRRSPLENQFAVWLDERGVTYDRQTPIGPYNVDFTLGTVAVEIFGGSWHATPARWRHFLQRAKYLFDHGFALVMVWHYADRYPLSAAAADYVIACAQQASGDVSAAGQYWVVRGDGKLCTHGRYDGHGLPDIPTSRSTKRRVA